eukprot:938034_1
MALRWDARQIIGCVHCKTTVTWRNYSRHSQIIHNVIFSKDDVQCHIRSADVFVHGYILGRCHHHTKMDISNIDNLHCNADITKYFQGTHIQDLYPQSHGGCSCSYSCPVCL